MSKKKMGMELRTTFLLVGVPSSNEKFDYIYLAPQDGSPNSFLFFFNYKKNNDY